MALAAAIVTVIVGVRSEGSWGVVSAASELKSQQQRYLDTAPPTDRHSNCLDVQLALWLGVAAGSESECNTSLQHNAVHNTHGIFRTAGAVQRLRGQLRGGAYELDVVHPPCWVKHF
jgi:hypothetical protein